MFDAFIPPAFSDSNPQKRLTKAEAEAQLVAEVAAHLALVRSYTVHNDTARGLTPHRVDAAVRDELDDINGNEKKRKIVYKLSRTMRYGHRFDAQKPKDAALARLDELVPRHIINGIERAYDLRTDDPASAKTLAWGLSRRITERWRRPNAKTGRAGDGDTFTFYLDARLPADTQKRRRTRRNLTVYLRGNIVRVEPRYFSAKTCGKRGVRRSTDLIDRDRVEMIDDDFRISAIWEKKLVKLVEDAARDLVEFMVADDPDSAVPLAVAEEIVWDGIAFAVDQRMHPNDPEPTMQDLIDAHPILNEAAIHIRLSEVWFDSLL